MEEKNKKLGQEPAFPIEKVKIRRGDADIIEWRICTGISKRFYAACAAMQGLLSANSGFEPVKGSLNTWHCESIIEKAYEFADELLKQE